MAARIPVYEDFKQQFLKFFKTKGTLRIDPEQTTMSNSGVNSASFDNSKSIFQLGKKAYMGYYIQKITGLNFLVESNKPGTLKYITDYRKDVITLDFLEDVSLSVGTLTHLYKLLYWSKPNGKGIYEVGTCAGNIEFDLNGRRTGTNPPDLLAGTPTILFIGDSMVAGFEVDGDKTMAAYARKEFLKKGISVRVINGGVRGYNVL